MVLGFDVAREREALTGNTAAEIWEGRGGVASPRSLTHVTAAFTTAYPVAIDLFSVAIDLSRL